VLATRGADEGIELLIRTFCEVGDSILINPPTYGMYAISAQTNSVNTVSIPTLDGFQLDKAAIIKQLDSVKLVFICSPNNPTGQIINRKDIIEVLDAAKDKAIVVADEAYIEFCPEFSVKALLNDYPNLVILRTLSKGFGLAGLRCGFTLASSTIINALKKVIAPYPIPAPVAQIASQVLSPKGVDWMKSTVNELNALKQDFIQHAEGWSFVEKVYPSDTNFVLVKFAQTVKPATLMQYFVERHILLRDQSKQPQLEGCLRVSIGNSEQMSKVIQLFQQFENTL
jgi:histidinol-phosphate aminotransferase